MSGSSYGVRGRMIRKPLPQESLVTERQDWEGGRCHTESGGGHLDKTGKGEGW